MQLSVDNTHSAHKQTPAMAAGLADHVWTVEEVMAAAGSH
jgi:hypothetical protein